MLGPSIDAADVGLTGLVWLFLSYGYILYVASGLISEGSELLLLVPSLAGLVGGVVLPLLGAVPDGAIVLFSGLGSIDTAQETLSVGVGALAGSTIMLLTIPFGLSVIAGRVDCQIQNGKRMPYYMGKPKKTPKDSFWQELVMTGVTMTNPIHASGKIMILTTIPYFLIQVPASFLHGPTEEIAKGEKWYALSGLVTCLLGLVFYLWVQIQQSKEGQDRDKRTAVIKKFLQQGRVSLSGAISVNVGNIEAQERLAVDSPYQSTATSGPKYPSPAVASYLKDVLGDVFITYDSNGNGNLDLQETFVFFRDLHETMSEPEMKALFDQFDTDNNGYISFDEFIGFAYNLIKSQGEKSADQFTATTFKGKKQPPAMPTITLDGEEEIEEEEIPEEFTNMSPSQQQAAIKKRAFFLLFVGTVLVVLFSDPMVDVMQEIANRANLSPFYVSFVLAPLASNASEVLSSQYYASKKTKKTISVALTALEGAASMNNTFCLSIFMGLIYFRGLAWQYTAETIAIVLAELALGLMVQADAIYTIHGVIALLIFPLSIAVVAGLEAFGFD